MLWFLPRSWSKRAVAGLKDATGWQYPISGKLSKALYYPKRTVTYRRFSVLQGLGSWNAQLCPAFPEGSAALPAWVWPTAWQEQGLTSTNISLALTFPNLFSLLGMFFPCPFSSMNIPKTPSSVPFCVPPSFSLPWVMSTFSLPEVRILAGYITLQMFLPLESIIYLLVRCVCSLGL